MTPADYCCIDYPIEQDLHAYGAVPFSTKWPNGMTIRVGFLDGGQDTWALVAKYAQEWTQYANLKLDFSGGVGVHIRVSFAVPGQSFSTIGADALKVPAHQATMNYG